MAKQKEEVANRRPDYVVRCRTGPPEKNFWLTIGAMWSFKNGEDGYSLKLNSLPVGFAGDCVLLPPRDDESE